MKYAVIYERSSNGWGAFVPDLPGCVALGFTLEETVPRSQYAGSRLTRSAEETIGGLAGDLSILIDEV